VARSEEAKALGIEAAVPAFAIKELIEKHNVAVFSSNYTLYVWSWILYRKKKYSKVSLINVAG
jgi:hypothetical protein